ncbi:response regulator transcription factor [Lederbergia lenta]|uniref:response regulator transcription factor n=1 Tax=Lederbergia lenta TaxID=1467 RepID=UPI00203ADF31|nr:response regulator transcription factor [Lederbergia lenta]
MSNRVILIVEDEVGIRELIQLFLQKKGYHVLTAKDGTEALPIVESQKIDIILLDIEMPGSNGFEVCEQIRQQTKAPVVFVSCKKETADRIKGLKVGGDDFITKPFDFHELEARIQAILRRNQWLDTEKMMTSIIRYGDLQIDTDRCELYVKGKQIQLFHKEFQLLLLMARHPNQVWTVEQLYDHIWGFNSEGTAQTVKVHISNLRRKLEKDPANPQYIKTVRGFGYKFMTTTVS